MILTFLMNNDDILAHTQLKVACTSGHFSSKIMNGIPYFMYKQLTIRLIKYINKTYYHLNFILTA